MRNLFLIMFIFAIAFGCKEAITDEETSAANPDSEYYVRIQGFATNGPCREGGRITGIPVDETFTQQVGHFISELLNHLGQYDLPAEIPTRRAEVFGTFDCYNETSDGITYGKEMKAIIDLESDHANSITPLTTISANVSRHLMDNGFGTADQCIIEAERLILEYVSLPNYDVRFTNIKLNEGLGSDVLLAFNSAITLNRDSSLQSQLMTNISEDIKAGTTVYRDSLRNSLRDLPIITVKNNVESIYASLGTTMTSPAFWKIIDSDGDGVANKDDPDSLVELLDRTPVIQYLKIGDMDNGYVSFSGSSLKYAHPVVFTAQVLTSNYIGMNLDGDYAEVWTKKTINTCRLTGGGFPVDNVVTCDLPDALVSTAHKARENYIGSSIGDVSGLPTNSLWKMDGSLLTPGQEYYMIVYKDSPYSLTKKSSVDPMPFGKLLFWDQDCLVGADVCTESWIGYSNTGNIHDKDGFQYYLTD